MEAMIARQSSGSGHLLLANGTIINVGLAEYHQWVIVVNVSEEVSELSELVNLGIEHLTLFVERLEHEQVDHREDAQVETAYIQDNRTEKDVH